MSNDLNQCNFIGRLGQEPEIRHMSSGEPVANLSLAVGWKGKEKEGVEWIRVVAFGKLAEIIGQYLKKGSRIFVSGKMKTRKWQDQSGQDKYSTEIVASDLQMLDSRPDSDSAPRNNPAQHASGNVSQTNPTSQPAPQMDSFDDDVPF